MTRFFITPRKVDMNETWDEYKIRMCNDMFTNDISIVTVQFASSRYIKAQQSVCVTYVDKVSAFGKLYNYEFMSRNYLV